MRESAECILPVHKLRPNRGFTAKELFLKSRELRLRGRAYTLIWIGVRIVMEMKARLLELITDLEDEKAIALVKKMIGEGADQRLLLDICLEGMSAVGEKYIKGQYYVAALIMAGELMGSILRLINLENLRKNDDRPSSVGSILIGTIEGDIHDIGKNLAGSVLLAAGFEVHNLGVDVAPEIFLAETLNRKPDIVGISMLLYTCYPHLKRAVELLKTMVPTGYKRPKVIIGGGALEKKSYIKLGADAWATDISKLVDLCSQLVGGRTA